MGGPPPGGDPWGGQGFGAPPPAPKKNNNTGLLIGGIAGGVVVIILLVVGVVVFTGDDGGGGGGGEHKKPNFAAGAKQHLGKADGIHYTGTYTRDGEKLDADVGITKGGSAIASLTVGGDSVKVLIVNHTTYIKADKSYWEHQDVSSSDAEQADGTWARAPGDTGRLTAANLTPSKLAAALQQASAGSPGPKTTVNGAPAVKYTVGTQSLYISTAKPYRLLRVESSGRNGYRLDATAIDQSGISALFGKLRSGVKALKEAVVPGVRFNGHGKVKFGKCNSGGCRVKWSFTATAVGTSASSVTAVMKAKITARDKKQGTCTDTKTISLAGSKTVHMACTVHDHWSSWYHWARSTPGNHKYYAHVEVHAEAAKNVVDGLLKKLEQEQAGD